jgi:hypothetical protein
MRKKLLIGGGIAAAVLAVVIVVGLIFGNGPKNAFNGAVDCTGENGMRLCDGKVKSFDGTELDVNLAMPHWGKGPWPLILTQGGWPGGKFDADSLKFWTSEGYAALSISNRGLGDSGGSTHFMDTRYEVRDAQALIGELVDDGIAKSDRIGAFGGSYGGGEAMTLGALRDRVMQPDGHLTPWRSPDGTPLAIQVAVAQAGWTDLAEGLLPNGHLAVDSGGRYSGPVGPFKQSTGEFLYSAGAGGKADYGGTSHPDSNFAVWYQRLTSRSQSPPSPQQIANAMTAYHSAAGIDDAVAPAPAFMVNGLSDDIFPPNQSIPYMNKIRAQHPDVPVAVMIADVGHPRAQNKEADVTLARERELDWLNHYLKDDGDAPASGVTVVVPSCGGASGEPVQAESLAAAAGGELVGHGPASGTIAPAVGGPELVTGRAYAPFGGQGTCAVAPAQVSPGTVTSTVPAGPNGFTLIGAARVTATFSTPAGSQVAARLLDVGPDGTARLVARGVWMPEPGSSQQSFELPPSAWRFEPGHTARLELLPADPGYDQVLATQGPVDVSGLVLRLPVLEH